MVQLSEKGIFRRLERLERAINVPIVSGEAAEWLETVTTTAKEVEAATCEYYRTVHPDLFHQMNELDPDQNPRVQMLEQEDEEICACLRDVVGFAEKLSGAGDLVEPDERLLANATHELSERVIDIILRIRKHETQVSTWHVEALARDRGAVD